MLPFRPPGNQWLETTLCILLPTLHFGQGSDGASVSAPLSISSGWHEGGLPHIWRLPVGRRPRQWAPGASLCRWSLSTSSLKHGGSGRLALLHVGSGILRCLPKKGIVAEAVSLCMAWLWMSGGVPSALPSAHPYSGKWHIGLAS